MDCQAQMLYYCNNILQIPIIFFNIALLCYVIVALWQKNAHVFRT